MNHSKANHLSPNYQLQVPAEIQHILLAGLSIGVIGLILAIVLPIDQRLIATVLIAIGLVAAIPSAMLVLVTSGRVRLAARHRMMQAIPWRGDEMVLDVGCGNGFLLLDAAKHLTTGKAIGIDVWQEGAGHQTADEARRNAPLEGVADKIDIQNVDATRMPYERASFDVIMSSLALHHMGSDANREQAVREMLRVLKPGGMIVLYDMFPMINQASTVMKQSGLTQIKRLGGFPIVVLSAKR
jgi:SAM-dependent methyltransferase